MNGQPSTRVQDLARQAWRRISDLHHDPEQAIVEAIDRALAEAPNRVVGRSQRQVVEHLRKWGPSRLKAVSAVLTMSPSAASSVLRRLVLTSVIERRARGVYALVVAPPAPAAVAS